MTDLSASRFEASARRTVDAMPEPFRALAGEVALLVADWPDEAMLDDLGIDDPLGLTGLYEGIPMTEKSVWDSPVQPDTVPGHAGPLAGILAGMRWAQENAPDLRFVATAATDTPFFPADYVARLAEASALAADTIAIAATNGRRHPVFGLWPVSIADGLQTFLVSGETRRVTRFIEQHRCVEIDFGHREGPDPFFNINTPDDLETAERHAAASASTR